MTSKYIYRSERVVYNCLLDIHYDPNNPEILVNVLYPKATAVIPLVFHPPEYAPPANWPDYAASAFAQFILHYAQQQLLEYNSAGGRVH